MEHIKALFAYNKAALSALPCKLSDKYPSMLSGWRKFMEKPPEQYDLGTFRNYKDCNTFGVCIVCGAVSGSLEVIDIDNHLDTAESVFNELTDIDEVQKIIQRYDIPIEQTPGGGYHLFYRCAKIEGNQKLSVDGKETVIETRGEGGLIVCAPSKGYTLMSGSLTDIPIITEEERETLLSYCRSFDKSETQEPDHPTYTPDRREPRQEGERPGDLFNRDGVEEAKSMLKAAGWIHLSGKHWRRPGKKTGVSATFGHIAPDVFYPFSSNSPDFEPRRCYHPFDIMVTLQYNGDYSAAARELAKRYEMPPRTPQEPAAPVKQPNGKPQPNEEKKTNSTPTNSTPKEDPGYLEIFWGYGKKGAFKIDFFALRNFLQKNGYFRYEINKDKFMFLKIEKNVATETNFMEIRDFILSYLERTDRIEIYNEFMDSSKFNQTSLSIVAPAEVDWIRDKKDRAFLFFQNCIVEADKTGIKTHDYGEFKGVVWSTQIIKRDFIKLEKEEYQKSDVAKFAKLVSNSQGDRISAYRASMGFLMHTFKKASFCPVIIFNDENMTDKPTGGTGKGLSVKFVQQLRNVVTLDGKNFDSKNQFAMQQIGQDTNVLFLDDIIKGFKFEQLFSMITTGFTIRKLYTGEVFLPFDVAPKIAITTNYAIKSKGDSFTRRIFEIEIHKYFKPDHTPEDEFKREPFTEWDVEEWTRFDNYMIACLVHYLNVGLVKPNYVALEYNKLKADTNADFVLFAEDELSLPDVFSKADLIHKFREYTDDKYYQNNLGQRRFTEWCRTWAEYNGWTFEARCGAGGQYMEFIKDGNSQLSAVETETDPVYEPSNKQGDIPF